MSDQTINQKPTIKERVVGFTETPLHLYAGQQHLLVAHFNRTLREIFDEIERRAETNMMKTHKLEGMHYAALKEVREELGVGRKG